MCSGFNTSRRWQLQIFESNKFTIDEKLKDEKCYKERKQTGHFLIKMQQIRSLL